MERELITRLAAVQRRLRQYFCWTRLAALAMGAAAISFLLWFAPEAVSRVSVQWLAAAIILASGVIWAVTAQQFSSLTDVAQRIEREFPELQERLITTVSQLQRPHVGPRRYLEATVMEQALVHSMQTGWPSIVSTRGLWGFRGLAGLGLLLAGGFLWQIYAEPTRVANQPAPPRAAADPSEAYSVVVEPGNAEVERGAPLIVAARFPDRVPREATLWIQPEGAEPQQFEMRRSLEDPLFAAHLPRVDTSSAYRVTFAGRTSDEFRLHVFEYPNLIQADAELAYPEYTQLPPKLINDTRRVSAVEGSRLTWTARLNKSVREAWLEDQDGQRHALRPLATDDQAYQMDVTLESDQKWILHLRDEAGRENKLPPELVARVLKNRPPELKPSVARDLSVSPLEELTVSALAWDDFGITQYGIAYSLATAPSQDHVLGGNVAAQQETPVAYELNFESLEAQPDQLLAYHFWAEDIGPDGQPRRTRSDIYLADVRHFEEIFREGEAPPDGEPSAGQMSGNAQQSEELLQTQKQIIVATWNLLRRETQPSVSASFAEDVQLLVESQQEALAKLEQLGQRIEDAESAQYLQQVQQSMTQSVEYLQRAAKEQAVEPLPAALTTEQVSYQGLLQLRAREHEVVRGNPASSSAGGGSGSARRQQLQELELRNDVNRYEAQRQAAPQSGQDEAAREMRQILSRLRDLARRQQDVNKQLRELQLALQQAATPEEREELTRQLKRLRDQQEQMLRDTDDVQERMDQARNQPQLQETRQQLEESRERLQQSAQATSEGNTPEALAAGTRAERQFEQMTDQLRKQAANQFGEQMQELRQAARDLEQAQERIAEKLRDSLAPAPGLRAGNDAQELQDQLAGQEEQLGKVMQDMEQTIQEAESAEPLLAQKLYDTYRDASQQQIQRQLQDSRELLQNGLRDDALDSEAAARQGIRQLREGVEDAAEGILGDESEGLRRAASTLAELAEQLNRELKQFESREATERSSEDATEGAGQPQSEQSSAQESRQGQEESQQQGGQQQGGQQQGGQQQGGQQQGGQQQGGQQQGGQQQGGQQQGGQQRGGSSGGAERDGGGLVQSLGESLGSGPITGDEFGPWSDQLRDVEEMVDDAELRARAAQIRDRARSLRRDMKRRSEPPQWNLVREMIASPLEELRQQVEQELARRTGQRDQLVPVDRDPIPGRFADRVQKYYERLGQGE